MSLLLVACVPNAPCSYEIARTALGFERLTPEMAYMPYVVVQGFGYKLRTTRLPPHRLQLEVYIDSPPRQTRRVERAVRDAAAEGVLAWSGLPGPSAPEVRIVDDREGADFVVTWFRGDSARIGEMQYWRDTHDALEWEPSRWIRLDVRLIQEDGTQDAVRWTAAHEFGHVLGLSGHSLDPADVMFALMRKGRGELTSRDRTTLQVLYACEAFAVWQGPRPELELSARYRGVRAGFDRYLAAESPKAFAVTIDDRMQSFAWGAAVAEDSLEAAVEKALASCNESRAKRRLEPCRIFAIDDAIQTQPLRTD